MLLAGYLLWASHEVVLHLGEDDRYWLDQAKRRQPGARVVTTLVVTACPTTSLACALAGQWMACGIAAGLSATALFYVVASATGMIRPGLFR